MLHSLTLKCMKWSSGPKVFQPRTVDQTHQSPVPVTKSANPSTNVKRLNDNYALSD